MLTELGKSVIDTIKLFGELFLFSVNIIKRLFHPPCPARFYIKELNEAGMGSLSVVLTTGVFTGLVLAIQSYYQFRRVELDYMVGAVVAISMSKELGPVLVGIMLAGRVGAKIAAELASMKVSNQIDAMGVLSIDPYKYLVFPRVFALTVMSPFLTALASFIGIIGASALSIYIFYVDKFFYLQYIKSWLDNYSIFYGLIKSVFFGMAVGIVSCYRGLKTEGGAEDVGKATTEAVVNSSIIILFLDFLLDLIL